MSIYLCVEVILALLFFTMKASADPRTFCDGSATAHCPPQGKRITETPAGLVDGRNNVFMLAGDPRDLSELRLFSNGAEMTQGTEFQVNGREIRITARFVPSKGSFLQVSYITSFSSANGRGVEESQDRLHTLTREILLQSIATPPLSLPRAVPDDSSARVSNRAVTLPPPKLDASLTLLTRRINERRVEARKRKPKEKSSEPSTLSGFEGVGDLPLPSPYASLLDPSAGTLERSLSPTMHADASSHQRLKSFSMLEQRLNSESATDTRTEGR